MEGACFCLVEPSSWNYGGPSLAIVGAYVGPAQGQLRVL